MKIAVIGAGAMGSIYASFLAQNNNEVIAIDLWEEHLDAIRENGLRVSGFSGDNTVKNIKVFNKAGGNYSGFAYDTEGATKDGVVYPSYEPCIFEVKYPDLDIKGRVTAL